MMDREPRTQRGRNTLSKLLDAAVKEFGERGYHDAAIIGITQRAGVALGSFYTYFQSKEELYRELVRTLSRNTRHHVAEAVKGAPDRIAAERAGLKAFIEFVREHRELYRIIEEAQFVAEDVYREHYQSFAEGYRRGLGAAAERGEITNGDADARGWALIGMSVFLGMRYALWSDDLSADEVADMAAGMIGEGLRPR